MYGVEWIPIDFVSCMGTKPNNSYIALRNEIFILACKLQFIDRFAWLKQSTTLMRLQYNNFICNFSENIEVYRKK